MVYPANALGSILMIGDEFHIRGPCKKAVFACLAWT